MSQHAAALLSPTAAPEEQWIVTANALADGSVRYLTSARTWTGDLQQAWFGPASAAEAMLVWSRAQEAVVCDPYILALDRVEERLVPRSQRERIRAEGPRPTLRRLGYDAGRAEPVRHAV